MTQEIELPRFLTNPQPEIYLSDNYVVLDFETTNLDSGSALNPDNRLVLSTWRCGSKHRAWTGRTAFEYLQSLPVKLHAAIDSADFIVAQNAKFELQWLQREGVDISKLVVWDTMLGEYVRLGNRRGPKDLDSIATRYGIQSKQTLVKLLISGGVCPSQIPEGWLIEYGCKDTEITEQVFLHQRRELQSLGLLPHLYTRCLLTPVLADIERNGMQLDREAVEAEYTKEAKLHRASQAALDAVYPGVNWGSPKQLAKLLYVDLGFAELCKWNGDPDRTDAGAPRTDADTIGSLRAETEAQETFRRLLDPLKEAEANLKYLEKMKLCCDENGGMLYAAYNQAVTQNHRLSSSGRKYKLQFQNFPRRYKRLFKARFPNWFVAEGDGMGMEFRIAAHLGRDDTALADIRSKADVHKATASQFLQKSPDSVTPDERQDHKPETFRPLYGSKGQTPAQKRYAAYFQNRYKGIYDTQTGWTYDVLKDKKLVTEWGLIFYWPDARMSQSGYISNTTNIFNYPVSSLATAEIIPITLIFVWHLLRAHGLNSFLVNTIHDSVVGEVPEYEREEFQAICRRAFTSDTLDFLDRVYNTRLVVPLGVELKFGTNWSEKDGGKDEFELDPLNFFPA
jgi:DNA polymerase I-like protein with 3'-5' exonuclease and polymerase domains